MRVAIRDGFRRPFQLLVHFSSLILREVIAEVVNNLKGCGDFAKGFARMRCDECSHDYLLDFSCKGHWFCPSCHQRKVPVFGARLADVSAINGDRSTPLQQVLHTRFERLQSRRGCRLELSRDLQ
jgi:hypothetical protein